MALSANWDWGITNSIIWILLQVMSAYGHQMEQMYSARSLSGGSEMRSSFVLESGFYITSFAATIFIAGFAAVGVLLITLLVSLALMLQSCQNNNSGVIELQNTNDDYSYCKVYSLHAKLDNLEGHNLPNICKDLAIQYIKGGQYARDLDLTKSVIEDYFNSVRPANDGLDVVLIDIDGILPPNPYSSNSFHRSSCHLCYLILDNVKYSISNCILEAKNLKRMLVIRLYMNLQASGWSIILLSREPRTHQNVTINHLLSAGFRGWASLMMRAEDEDSTKANEYFSRQRNVIQKKGFQIVVQLWNDEAVLWQTAIRMLGVVDFRWRFSTPLPSWLPKQILHNPQGQIIEVTRGEITKAKNHLTGSSNNVKVCPKCPKEVQEELKAYAKDKKKQNSFEIPNVQELDLENAGFGESEDELDNYRDFLPPSSAMGKKNVAKKRPMDLFCRKPETTIEKERRKN
ncbi:HAD superfamily [Sesbania bispinosa]|nr:HAD superfamily [Sesbania bispinosa]